MMTCRTRRGHLPHFEYRIVLSSNRNEGKASVMSNSSRGVARSACGMSARLMVTETGF